MLRGRDGLTTSKEVKKSFNFQNIVNLTTNNSIAGTSVLEASMDEGSLRGKGEFARKYHSSITKVVP